MAERDTSSLQVVGFLPGCACAMLFQMREPTFTKEYYEDIIPEADEEYRYWDYVFDFGDRQYSARIYLDELNVACVHLSRGSRWTRLALWRDASRDPRLQAICGHLRADTGRPIEVHALTPWGGNRGYRRVAWD